MNKENRVAMTRGVLVWEQNFRTEKGLTRLVVRRHKHQVFAFKHVDGVLVEVKNLSRMPGRAEVKS